MTTVTAKGTFQCAKCGTNINISIDEETKQFLCRGCRPEGALTRDAQLWTRLNEELSKFIVHEEAAREAVLLITLGGVLTTNASPTSKNLLLNDESGVGKDFVTRNVLKLLPAEWVLTRQRISERVLSYWHANEAAWSWNGRVLYLEDAGNNVLNSEALKVFASNGEGEQVVTVLNNQRPQELVVRGKPVLVLTSATAAPDHEQLRRFPVVSLTASRAQTQAILKRIAERAKTAHAETYDASITAALRTLDRVSVSVPFSDALVRSINTEHVIVRTNFPRLLDLVRFSAAVHQRQRERGEGGDILATLDDYDIARRVMLTSTSNALTLPLTVADKEVIEVLRRHKETKPTHFFTASEVEPDVTVSERQLRRILEKLVKWKLARKRQGDRERDQRRPVIEYQLSGVPELQLPTRNEIVSTMSDTSTVSYTSIMSVMSSTSSDGPNDISDITASQISDTTPPKEERIREFDRIEVYYGVCGYCGAYNELSYRDERGHHLCGSCKQTEDGAR